MTVVLMYDRDLDEYVEAKNQAEVKSLKEYGFKGADTEADWEDYTSRNRQYTCAEI